MFATGLKKIFEKISNIEDRLLQQTAFNQLENKLVKNPYIKHQFEVMSEIKKNKGSITTQEAFTDFVKGLKEKKAKFLSEHKAASHLTFHKETKALLEYYNINPKEVMVDELDAAVDMYATAKNLNESAIRNIVFNKKSTSERPVSGKNTVSDTQKPLISLKSIKKDLKESFLALKKSKNDLHLTNEFNIINFLSECMDNQNKKMIQSSLGALKEAHAKKSPGVVDKLYKLRVVSEKLFYEGKGSEYGGSKTARYAVKGTKFIKNIIVSTNTKWQRPESITLRMEFFVYPIGAGHTAVVTSSLHTKRQLETLNIPFADLCINKAGRSKYFDTNSGLIWDVKLRKQAKKNEPAEAKITAYIHTNKAGDGINTWEDFVREALATVREFDSLLPELMDSMAPVLTPEAQKNELAYAKTLSPDELRKRIKSQADAKLIKKSLTNNNTARTNASEDAKEKDWFADMIFRGQFPDTPKFKLDKDQWQQRIAKKHGISAAQLKKMKKQKQSEKD